MKIKASKKLIEKVCFIARLLDIGDFDLEIKRSKSANWLLCNTDGSFTMKLQKDIHKDDIMRLLAHEMVHLKQYKTDRLRDEQGYVYWEGEHYIDAPHLSDGYWLSPWEIEARGMEEYILYKWNERSKNELH